MWRLVHTDGPSNASSGAAWQRAQLLDNDKHDHELVYSDAFLAAASACGGSGPMSALAATHGDFSATRGGQSVALVGWKML